MKEDFEESIPKAREILSEHLKDVPYAALSFWFKDGGVEITLCSNENRLKVLEKYGIEVVKIGELLKRSGLI